VNFPDLRAEPVALRLERVPVSCGAVTLVTVASDGGHSQRKGQKGKFLGMEVARENGLGRVAAMDFSLPTEFPPVAEMALLEVLEAVVLKAARERHDP
jgi:hypothetical protein